jgi:DNA-binding MarR family transcriptional regulator
VDFDGTDIAILRIAESQPAGYAISAPDLVAHFRLRPSIVQKSLDRLSENRLLEHSVGHTDGYENYRLTSAGAAFARTMR